MAKSPDQKNNNKETENGLPQFAKTILVPVSKPETAPQLIRLALRLLDKENGKVTALVVADGEDNEGLSEAVEELQLIVDSFIAAELPVELKTVIAGSVSRGILDAARDQQADMLVIGVQDKASRKVKLGSIVENVAQAATCDVLIYRSTNDVAPKRVLVTYRGTTADTNAMTTGVLLAKATDSRFLPLYVQRDYNANPRNERMSQQAFSLLEGEYIRKEIIPGNRPEERILSMLNKDDLLVMGLWHKENFDQQIQSDLTQTLLNRAPGSVLLVSRVVRKGTLGETIQRRLERYSLQLTEVERNELVWQAQQDALANIDYLLMSLLSALLASLGLLLNSTAVVIGAMLVAPFMQPLAAFSVGLITGMLSTTRRALLTIIEGTILALIISVVAGFLSLGDTPTAEMLARGTPSFLDAFIAIASGLVAGFATARKEIPVALAGVAIAAALMPPITTVGLALAFNEWLLAAGAGLLFVTNILFIILAESIVFLWIGMRPGRRQESKFGTRVWWTLIVAFMITVVSLLVSLGQRALDEVEIRDFLLSQFAGAEYVDIDFSDTGEIYEIVFAVRAPDVITPEKVDEVKAALSEEFDLPSDRLVLSVAYEQLVQATTDERGRVLEVIQALLPGVSVSELAVTREEGGLTIEAELRTAELLDADDIERLKNELEAAFALPVDLSVAVQQFFAVTPQPSPTPDESDAGDDTDG